MKHIFLNHTLDYTPFLMDAEDGSNGGSATDETTNGGGQGDNGTNGAGNGAADAGDNGDTGTKQENKAPTLEEQIAAAVAKEVEGLKNKNRDLIEKNKKLAEEAKKAPQLSDEEYKQFLEVKERMARDELLKLMAEGKSEEAIAIATKRVKEASDAVITAEREAKERALNEAAQARAELENTKISIAVTQASASLVKPQYQQLVEKLVEGKVKVIDGTARVVDESGDVVMKGGKPATVTDLIEGLRPQYPDLFNQTAGGGAGGSSTKTGGTTGGKISPEEAEKLPYAEWLRLREAGKIG